MKSKLLIIFIFIFLYSCEDKITTEPPLDKPETNKPSQNEIDFKNDVANKNFDLGSYTYTFDSEANKITRTKKDEPNEEFTFDSITMSTPKSDRIFTKARGFYKSSSQDDYIGVRIFAVDTPEFFRHTDTNIIWESSNQLP